MKWFSHKTVGAGAAILGGIPFPGIIVVTVSTVIPDLIEAGIMKHRGWSHGWWVWTALAALALILYPDYRFYILCAFAGIILHLVCDALTITGVPAVPFSDAKLALRFFRTGSAAEYVAVATFVAIVFYLSFKNPAGFKTAFNVAKFVR